MRPEGGVPAQTQPPSGWAPWGTRQRMRMMAIFGSVLSVLFIILGIMIFARNGGVFILVLGCVFIAFWLVAIPIARRRGKV